MQRAFQTSVRSDGCGGSKPPDPPPGSAIAVSRNMNFVILDSDSQVSEVQISGLLLLLMIRLRLSIYQADLGCCSALWTNLNLWPWYWRMVHQNLRSQTEIEFPRMVQCRMEIEAQRVNCVNFKTKSTLEMSLTHSHIKKKAWGHIQALPYHSLNHKCSIEWYQIAGNIKQRNKRKRKLQRVAHGGPPLCKWVNLFDWCIRDCLMELL